MHSRDDFFQTGVSYTDVSQSVLYGLNGLCRIHEGDNLQLVFMGLTGILGESVGQ